MVLSGSRPAGPPKAHDRRARSRVDLAVRESRRPDGVVLQRVLVTDDLVHEASRQALAEQVERWDAALVAHPEWAAPRVRGGRLVLANPASEWMFASPALQEWRALLVPAASSLHPLQRPDVRRLPSGSPVDGWASRFFAGSLDAVGVRARAAVLTERVLHQVPGGAWVSLACGAAVPVLDARREVVAAGAPAPVLHLVDLDPDALAFAARLAEAEGLVVGADVHLLRRDLVRTVVAGTALLEELGEGGAGLVDALGIFEYFSDAACVRLLRHAFRLLAPGGVLVIANMLAGRPQLAFNQRGAGWPRLHVRTVEELVDLVRRAGLPLARTTVTLPTDGVYAVVDVVR